MVSVITDRVAASVEGAPVTIGGLGIGIIQCTNVSGTDTVLADTLPAITEYAANQYYSIRPAALNTGAVNVNFEDIGEMDLHKPSGSELDAGDFNPALEYLIKRYNSTSMRIVSPGF